MNKKFKWAGLMVAIVMIAASATPVFAQSDTDPTEVPAVVEESSSFLDNPIVLLLSTFFTNLFTVDEVEETPPPDESDPGTGEPTEVPEGEDGGEGSEIPAEEPTPVPTVSAEEQIAAMHTEDDLGFGEITKLLQIVTEAQESCELYGTNCDVTVDSLLDEYNTGVGMGELFAKYGKPKSPALAKPKRFTTKTATKLKQITAKLTVKTNK